MFSLIWCWFGSRKWLLMLPGGQWHCWGILFYFLTLAYVHTLWTVTLLFFKQYPKHWWYGAQQQPSVVFVFQRVSRDLLDLSMGLMWTHLLFLLKQEERDLIWWFECAVVLEGPRHFIILIPEILWWPAKAVVANQQWTEVGHRVAATLTPAAWSSPDL